MLTDSLTRTQYMLQIQKPLLTIGQAGGPETPMAAARMITSRPAAQALIIAGLGTGSEADAFAFYVDFMEQLFTSPAEELSSLELFLIRLINARQTRTAA